MKYLLVCLLIASFFARADANEYNHFAQTVHAAPRALTTAITTPVHIAVISPDQQSSDYWRRNLISMTARLEALQIPYQLDHYSSQPGQEQLQEQQLAQALKKTPDVLVINIDSAQIIKLLGRVLYRGKPAVIIQNQTTERNAWLTHPPLLYTGFDHMEGSRLLAEYLFDQHGNQARYAVLYGTEGEVSRLRGEGFRQVATRRHAPAPVMEYYTDNTPDKISRATHEILDNAADIDFIFCTTTDIALTAASTIQSVAPQTTITLNGWGGGEAELQAMAAGQLAVTVMRMNDDSGVSIAEAIKCVCEGRRENIPAVFSGEIKLLPISALSQVDAFKHQAFRYSGIQ